MASPVKFRIVKKVLADNEWRLVRQKGSHMIWESHDGRTFTLSTDRGDVPPAQIAELKHRTDMRALVLDGGMGTTLEALGHDVSSRLWGCELVDRDPAVIRGVHERYAAAGADLVETATYQLTVLALVEAGYSAEDAHGVMHKAASLVAPTSAETVLSLGPYGATLQPGQEYAGYYPPPYGPEAYVQGGNNTNYAPDTESYEVALAAFHLDRLRVYAADPSWAAIKWIAFETIPTTAEIRGVRRAMAHFPDKPFWITSAFPEGAHGQLGADRRPVPVAEVVRAMLGGAGRVPDGVGINCTNPAYIARIAADMAAAVGDHAVAHRPWFVLYPDGGSVYDVTTRTWRDDTRVEPDLWAQRVVDVARDAVATGCFEGAIVGGCCKSSFAETAALRRVVDHQSQR